MIPIKTALDMAEYVELTSGIIQGYKEKIASLEKQASVAAQAPRAEKEASLRAALDETAVTQTVGAMVSAGFLKEAERSKVEDMFKTDPTAALTCITKLAETETKRRIPSMGKSLKERDWTEGASFETKRASDAQFEEMTRRLYHRV
jgi:hypothetical protein